MANDLAIEPRSTALVLIDLQNSNLTRQLAPYSTAQVVANGKLLADALRCSGGTVIFVNVDASQVLRLPADQPFRRDPNAPPPPADAHELIPELAVSDSDLRITKKQWGAFYGTGLDQQLRRRNIRTIVMAGIATNFGVESTARAALDRGYELLFAEDAMTSVSAEAHSFAVAHIFPVMGRVRKTMELLSYLQPL
jgi:nicotinamidase-related amidase